MTKKTLTKVTIEGVRTSDLQPVPPDGGWGWIVCFASFWINGTVFGLLNSFGVIFANILESNSGEDQIAFKTSWVGSLCIGVTFLLSPLAHLLMCKLGPHITAFLGGVISCVGLLISSFYQHINVLYLTYGVMIGVGASLVYTPSVAILGHYFKQRIIVIQGIVTAGSSIFTVGMPLGIHYLLKSLGRSHTLHILSGMMALLVFCSLVFRPLHPNKDFNFCGNKNKTVIEEHSGCKTWYLRVKNILNIELLKNRNYVIWCVVLPIGLFGYFVPYVHLVQHIKNILPEFHGEILIMCLGGSSGIARIAGGRLACDSELKCVRFQQAALLTAGLSTLLIPVTHMFGVIIMFVTILGFSDGCFISLLGPAITDAVGQEAAPQAISVLLAICSLPYILGPPTAGWIYDQTGKYDIAFWISGAPFIAAAFLLFLIKPIFKKPPQDLLLKEDENVLVLGGGNACNSHVWPKQDIQKYTVSCELNHTTHQSNGFAKFCGIANSEPMINTSRESVDQSSLMHHHSCSNRRSKDWVLRVTSL